MNAATFDNFRTLLESAAGRTPEGETPARRTQLGTYAALSAVVMAALWGVAAGSVAPSLALQNLYKVPARGPARCWGWAARCSACPWACGSSCAPACTP